MGDKVISVRNLSKRYQVFENQRARLLHSLWPRKNDNYQEIWALKNINFEIKRGEAVAIIGRNGGGKSTLLQILTGILNATTGEVNVQGRVSALLELGSGFNPEYTGRDNVLLSALLLGFKREEILNRFEEIEAFAEIGSAIDRPVKTYSSGMIMRLAFAVQVLCEPDILIIDEALSVGDYFFRQKCFERLQHLHEKGLTLLFVSHDMNTVSNMCSRAIYLRSGNLHYDGERNIAIRQYLSEHDENKSVSESGGSRLSGTIDASPQLTLPEHAIWEKTYDTLPTEGGLLSVVITNSRGEQVTIFGIGEKATVKIFFVPDPDHKAHIYLNFKNQFGKQTFTTGTYFLNISPSELDNNKIAVAGFELDMNLGGGDYSLGVILGHPTHPNRLGTIIDQTREIGPLIIKCDYQTERAPFLGPFGLPVQCSLRNYDI